MTLWGKGVTQAKEQPIKQIIITMHAGIVSSLIATVLYFLVNNYLFNLICNIDSSTIENPLSFQVFHEIIDTAIVMSVTYVACKLSLASKLETTSLTYKYLTSITS